MTLPLSMRSIIIRCADAPDADNILRRAIAKKIENGGECFYHVLLPQ